LNPNHQQSS